MLSGSLFSGNHSALAGGGLYLRLEAVENAILTNNSFAGNLAGDSGLHGGGGIAAVLEDEEAVALSLHNNLFWDNSASAGEGADLHLANDWDADGIPASVTLMNNAFDQSAAGFYADVAFAVDPSNLDAVDPMFVDAASGDLHLQAGSPVIDRGDDTAPELPATDIDGEARISGAAVDIGADETSAAPNCDRNQDGMFNFRDILLFYRSCGGACSPGEIKGFIRECRPQ
ncbi:choice-of-anchor Q domain-containing protein [Thiocapsa sp. C2-2m]|uniref:choice-of-anchor Q domain-containing protein n=1 Tax=Thiocapsa sp. C2-2m TaxID=3137395 RepID=UPI0035B4CB4B